MSNEREEHHWCDIPNRRSEDKRLRKVEDGIVEIRTKLENGISERTRKHSEMLDTILDKQQRLEKAFYTQAAGFQNRTDINNEHIEQTRANVEELTKQQNEWHKTIQRLIVSSLMVAVSMIGWAVYHSDDISSVKEHIQEVVEDGKRQRNNTEITVE